MDLIERSVNEGIERSQKEPLKKTNFLLIMLAQFWCDWGLKHFT